MCECPTHAAGHLVDALAPAELQALATADIENVVSNTRLQEVLTDHPTEITRMLSRLCERGFLVSDNRRRWTTYRLAPEGIPQMGEDSGHSGHMQGESGQMPADVLAELKGIARPATERKLGKTELMSLIAALFVLFLLARVPVAGKLLAVLVMLMGVGALVMTAFRRNRDGAVVSS